ncbi:hypothetical protein FQN54_007737 [Arachnomyces sp. PD_36]|nr:hypothetical protein FQN54_007737 [Arachnomyces sp. PD_36]
MNTNKSYNEPSRDPRRAHLRVNTESTQLANGNLPEDSPQQPFHGSPASTAMSMSTDSAVGIRIRGTAPKPAEVGRDVSRAYEQFADHLTSFSTTSIKRDQASKRARARNSELKKVEERSSMFKSFVSQSQRSQKASGEELASVEQSLQEHLKVRNELVRAISGGMSNTTNEDMDSLRAELAAMREEAAKFKQEGAQAREANEQMKLEIQKLDRTVSNNRESTIAAREAESSRVESQLSSINGRLDMLLRTFDEISSMALSTRTEVAAFRSERSQIKDQLNTARQKLDSLSKSIGDTKGSLNSRMQQAIERLNDYQSRLDLTRNALADLPSMKDSLIQHQSLFDSLRDQLDELRTVANSTSNTALKINVNDTNAMKDLTKAVEALQEGFQRFEDEQNEKDDLVSKDSEETNKKIDAIVNDLKSSRDDLELLTKKLNQNSHENSVSTVSSEPSQSTAQSIAQPIAQSQSDSSIVALKQKMDQHYNLLTNAIQSLEHRYNNLTTEPIVRDMIREMQVMYPYASAAQEAIEQMKAELGELSRKSAVDIESLHQRVSGLVTGLETSREQHTTQSLSVEKQAKTIDSLTQRVIEVFDSAKTNASHIENLQSSQAIAEQERQAMIDTMNHERDRITQKISSMAVTSGTSGTADQQTRDELSLQIDNFRTRLEDVEETTATEVGRIGAQLTVLEDRLIEAERNKENKNISSRQSATPASSVDEPLALTASRKNSNVPGQATPRPTALLPPSRPKAMGSVKPLKRKSSESSSTTPTGHRASVDRGNDRGLHKSKKFKGAN